MSSIATRYNPQEVESKWYQYWESKGYFHSEPDDREPYTIVIPPPNVTGVLHMGHMLNNTIQDVLIRKARLDGKNACWVPGTDHASIATEAKVVKKLRAEGIKKSDLSRDEFLEKAWEWTEEYGGIILKQLRRLGASCDWERTAFTMDKDRSASVNKVFVDLYKKGKLYRAKRMINWDPKAQTVLSNEEVLHTEESAHLYHIKYQVEGADEYITIATRRPETIMGDAAVAVHPDDDRFHHLRGKKLIVPLIGRAVPVIFDDYVDREFGSGALKVTPAHDPNDYEIGKRHNLQILETINPDGTLNELAQIHIGKDRFEARKLVVKDLEDAGLLIKAEQYETSIGRSERTNAVVEPMLSLQWYVDMKAIAAPALDAVMDDEVEFFPKKYKNTYSHWMNNIRDWCISRQLWWGHRIPAYYYQDDVFVAESEEQALAQAQKKHPNISAADLKQDDDVLDTWFSSWLWPMSVFNGFQSREELEYYYPTQVLVTGWDIIFLWVARMIMAGYEWEDGYPFKHVYFTGMVRDAQRRKMSKSLGNSPDALKLIDTYGADGVRYGMLSFSPAGGDLLFNEKLCETGRNFCNKMWNALRLTQMFDVSSEKDQSASNVLAVRWFAAKMQSVYQDLQSDFAEYRLSEALVKLYSFIWTDFCSWYLEMIKPAYGEAMDQSTYDQTIEFFSQLMTLLHPFMPFISEEIWHALKERKDGEDCIVSSFNEIDQSDGELIVRFEELKELITNIRDQRNKNQIGPKESVELVIETGNTDAFDLSYDGYADHVKKLTNTASLERVDQIESTGVGQVAFLSGKRKYQLKFSKDIDIDAERSRLTADLEYAQGFVVSVRKKLDNERFVNNAPAAVVNKEKQKLADGLAKIKILEESLAAL